MPNLPDTNIWIRYLKQPNSPIHAQLSTMRSDEIVTCSIVQAELLHGAEKYGNPERRRAIVEQLLAPFHSVPFDKQDAVIYAKIRHVPETTGNIIGPYDLQIAAICLRHEFTLVTNNSKEFSRIPGLIVDDWLAEQTI